jgi:hypothetical protein
VAEVERYNVVIGSNSFLNTPCAIGMQRRDNTIVPLLHARIRPSDLQIQFSLDAQDEAGAPIRVRNNVPVRADVERCKVHHLTDRKLVVMRETGKTILDIRRTALLSAGSIEIYGDFFFEGVHILATEEGLTIGDFSNMLIGCQFQGCGGILLQSSGGFALGFHGIIPPFVAS